MDTHRKSSTEFDHLHCDPATLSSEDCTFLLKALELDAFSVLVSSLRAQGPLTPYKEAFLDHAKSILFISDDRYKAEFRRATNDQCLAHISQKLNPCYEVHESWSVSGSVQPPLYRVGHCVGTEMSESRRQSSSLADQLLGLANEHNNTLDDQDRALLRLIALPKTPAVPESLRPILKLSENDTKKHERPMEERMGSQSTGTASSPDRAASPPTRRKRRTKTYLKTMKLTVGCARAQPFIFPPINANSGLKLPRGNPDRRIGTQKPPESQVDVPLVSTTRDDNYQTVQDSAAGVGNHCQRSWQSCSSADSLVRARQLSRSFVRPIGCGSGPVPVYVNPTRPYYANPSTISSHDRHSGSQYTLTTQPTTNWNVENEQQWQMETENTEEETLANTQ